MTRNQRYWHADEGLQENLKKGKRILNGFPMVAHGVKAVREITDAIDLPIMIRGISPDYRLIDEIGLAGSHTGISGTPLIAFGRYSGRLPCETVIKNYQIELELRNRSCKGDIHVRQFR